MSRTSCFDQFLRSLSKTALTGLKASLAAVQSELQVAKAKALARSLTLGNLKRLAKNTAAKAKRSALQQVKEAMETYGMGNYLQCPTVAGLRRAMVSAVDNSTGNSDSADYNAAQLEVVADEQDKEASRLDAQIRFLDTQMAEIDAEIASRGE